MLRKGSAINFQIICAKKIFALLDQTTHATILSVQILLTIIWLPLKYFLNSSKKVYLDQICFPFLRTQLHLSSNTGLGFKLLGCNSCILTGLLTSTYRLAKSSVILERHNRESSRPFLPAEK